MRLTQVAVATALGSAILGGPANAAVIIDIFQSGGDVVATGSGTLDLTGLTYYFSGPAGGPGGVEPSTAGVAVGAIGNADVYESLSGPASFGVGGVTFASTGSGDFFGLDEYFGVVESDLIVPAGYVSGTALSGSSTFDGQTIASLGLTPGTYVYTWKNAAGA